MNSVQIDYFSKFLANIGIGVPVGPSSYATDRKAALLVWSTGKQVAEVGPSAIPLVPAQLHAVAFTDDLEVMRHRKPVSRTLSLTRTYKEYIPAYSLANVGKY